MEKQCTVCKDELPLRDMKYLDPIEDFICTDCLAKGRNYGVKNLEDGKNLTKRIRES